uniref:Putative arylsulfatase b ixodes scapularis arylsulfatase b n=1 Tax=Amblyomma triste TaxID=251400 RepID=A0A023G646_AMBTT
MLSWLLFISVACVAGSSVKTPFRKPPHIVFILVDDLGWADTSLHGSAQIPTPNLDALASTGVILNNYYVQPLCSPSRGALMTGLYPAHNGIRMPLVGAQVAGLPLQFKILPEHLKDLGYETHIVGKWHLGYFNLNYTPTYRGFDTFFGFHNGPIDYYRGIMEQEGHVGLDFWNGTCALPLKERTYATARLQDHAKSIIANRNTSKPLFLYLAHQAVHSVYSPEFLQAPVENTKKFPYIRDSSRKILAGGDVQNLGPLDGIDMWQSLSTGGPSPRIEVLLEFNNETDRAALRYLNHKIVLGTFSDEVSKRYEVIGGVRPGIDLDALQRNSKAGRVLKRFYGNPQLFLQGFDKSWRRRATVRCNEHGRTNFNSSSKVFLFDLESDPCELRNLADSNVTLLTDLSVKLGAYLCTLRPEINKEIDPKGFPENNHGVWAPWII